MSTLSAARDEELLARLHAPPDLREGSECLAYWRQRRRRLPWYRVAARREASRMIVTWEQRVRAALVYQRGVPMGARLEGAKLVAGVHLRRWARRAGATLAIAGTLFVLIPVVLFVDILVHVL
jgi:hypothetical protein